MLQRYIKDQLSFLEPALFCEDGYGLKEQQDELSRKVTKLKVIFSGDSNRNQ